MNSDNEKKVFWADPLIKAQQYLKVTEDKEKLKLRKKLISLHYTDLLVIRNNKALWELLLRDSDTIFRRQLCAQAYKITQTQITQNISSSSKTAFALLNHTLSPEHSITFTLGIMFNVPWQIIVEKSPHSYSYREYSEYYLNNTAKELHIRNIFNEKEHIGRNVIGYLISEAHLLIENTRPLTTGRWVTTYPEMDYFEFHLKYEPVLHKAKIKEISKAFPHATHVLTTYTPFRSDRSLWIIGPKPGKLKEFEYIIEILKQRDFTVFQEI